MTRSFISATAVLALLCSIHFQDATAQNVSSQDLENLVAPVALYPDGLLNMVLDASQHPSNLVQAGDFISNSQGKKPDPSWPPSVTALLKYPSVLTKLDDDLAWTTRLGNAVKSQANDVNAAVQTVRKKAQDAGNLVTNDKQKVVVVDNVIEVVPVNSQVVYVPTYNATQVYTPHPYAPLVGFGIGVAVGAALSHDNYWYGGYYRHNYYDHLNYAHGYTAAGAHGHVTHVGGPYGGVTHAGGWGPAGHTSATHVGGPWSGATHVSHTGFYGHTGATFGHAGGAFGGRFHGRRR